MKKLIFVALLVTVVASLCCTTVALAATPQEIVKAVKKIEGVEDAKVALSNNVCFVAIKPTGVISKLQCEKMRQQIVEAVKKIEPNVDVAVSFSVKLYCQVEKIEKLPAEHRQTEIDKLMDRLSKIPMPLKSK